MNTSVTPCVMWKPEGNANRHFVACSSQTNPGAQARYAGTYDDGFHDCCV